MRGCASRRGIEQRRAELLDLRVRSARSKPACAHEVAQQVALPRGVQRREPGARHAARVRRLEPRRAPRRRVEDRLRRRPSARRDAARCARRPASAPRAAAPRGAQRNCDRDRRLAFAGSSSQRKMPCLAPDATISARRRRRAAGVASQAVRERNREVARSPRSPRTPAPRKSRSSTVSSWSSRMMRRRRSTSPGASRSPSAAIARRRARRLRDPSARVALDRDANSSRARRRASAPSAAQCAPRSAECGLQPMIDVRSARAACEPDEPRERRKQHRGVDAAAERDDDTRAVGPAAANARTPHEARDSGSRRPSQQRHWDRAKTRANRAPARRRLTSR